VKKFEKFERMSKSWPSY